MPDTPNVTAELGQPKIYQLRVKGRLGPRWAMWFAPMELAPQANGDTILTGPVADQGALHGLLTKIRNLGLPLVSVLEVEPNQANGPDVTAEADHIPSATVRCRTST